ncbi:MAG: DUF4296 domain-containing protein [Bacteroidales bacterium]|jgi:hypothetical protein|nr:DUF4296 domain-containing protein [Bacteroidales bacterium]
MPDTTKPIIVKKRFFLNVVLWLLGCFILDSCGNRYRIPEDKFVDILTDMHLSKAYYNSIGITDARWMDTIPYNLHIVEKYGYKWTQFDSTVSWYCSHPKDYQSVYDEVIARLNDLEKLVSDELDFPQELWTYYRIRQLPPDGEQDSVAVNVLLKGIGKYIIKAKIRVYPEDASIDPRICMYWWRSDTTALGICDTFWVAPIRKDGLMIEYSTEQILQPGNSYTHLKGNWLHSDKNILDSTWSKRAEIKDISIYHIPQKFD